LLPAVSGYDHLITTEDKKMIKRIGKLSGTIGLIIVALTAAGIAPAQTGDPIETIRQRYTQINRNAPNYRKVKKNLSGFSAEGGEMIAYFHGPTVMKIVATYFGESGKATEEFYYWDGNLIFVLRKDSRYSKPLSGKVVATTEDRFYFNNDKLIRWIDEHGKQVAADSADYTENQSDHLKTAKQLSEGARSKNPTIEADQ
jgi:hypothetical protein